MILINIKNESKIPIYRQIMDQLMSMIDSNTLKYGTKLPSSRSMAEKMDVNRSTVYKAYQELWALGYIDSKPGSYSTVRKRIKVATPNNKKATKIIDWEKRSTVNTDNLMTAANERKIPSVEKDTINFLALAPEPRLMPIQEYRKCLNQVLLKKGDSLLQYGDPMGYGPLREFIADQMRRHSVSVSADEILITNGSQNAIDLVLNLLVEQGGEIAVEIPTYSAAIPLFKYHDAKILGIPLKEDGMDLNVLENIMQTNHPALVYTMPNFQNPTGITTSQSHREKLLRICEKYRVPLLEDGFVEEMKYFGKSVLPVKSMDKYNIVFYLGTFSKILFPGLRIGWVAADRTCIGKLCAIKSTGEISGNILNQAALNLFCRLGYHDLHIKRVHRIYRKRMQTALKVARDHLTHENVSYSKPSGGYTIWVSIKDVDKQEEEIIKCINEYGVTVSPGKMFFSEPTDQIHFRISIAQQDEDNIAEGIKRIGQALGDVLP